MDNAFAAAWIGFGHSFAFQDESDQVVSITISRTICSNCLPAHAFSSATWNAWSNSSYDTIAASILSYILSFIIRCLINELSNADGGGQCYIECSQISFTVLNEKQVWWSWYNLRAGIRWSCQHPLQAARPPVAATIHSSPETFISVWNLAFDNPYRLWQLTEQQPGCFQGSTFPYWGWEWSTNAWAICHWQSSSSGKGMPSVQLSHFCATSLEWWPSRITIIMKQSNGWIKPWTVYQTISSQVSRLWHPYSAICKLGLLRFTAWSQSWC